MSHWNGDEPFGTRPVGPQAASDQSCTNLQSALKGGAQVIGCHDARNRIALYVDRELSGSEALEFEAHLTDCVPCRLAYEDSRAVIDGVRAASPLYEVPEHSYAAIEQIVAAQDKDSRRHGWLPLAAAAALVAG